ncbi:NAD(P)H-binding protein [Diaminobutyricibacter sp. McL0608]|uniref:NAD(P)H-binding protein n=1 Tax=Leifsonia sp. McL0608 TaxID=3143537 RepID=UPI0031F310CC
MTIVITGGNGEFGRGVIDALLARDDSAFIGTTVRDVEKAAELRNRGVQVRAGSFDEPEKLPAAFDGATTVLINATFFGATPQLRGQRVAAAITAANEAGAERVVLTSWPDLEHTKLGLIQDYATSEELLKSTAPDWTILRFGYGLADAVARDVTWAIRDGELVAPAAGARSAPASVADLAEASAAAVLADSLSGSTLELTGPRSLDWEDLAELASRLSERTIPFREVDDDEYRTWLAASGIPSAFSDGLIDLYAEFRSGWAARPTTTLGELLGRTPTDGLEAVRQRV